MHSIKYGEKNIQDLNVDRLLPILQPISTRNFIRLKKLHL
jgi:hypothetical protein